LLRWFFQWSAAWDAYFPRYAVNDTTSGTRAFFLNNVPWVFPIFDMLFANETFRFVGDPNSESSVVGFKPAFNWQEDGPSGGNPANATVIAGMISDLPLGSVQYVYVIQNTNLRCGL
jgi:hypothetical protein